MKSTISNLWQMMICMASHLLMALEPFQINFQTSSLDNLRNALIIWACGWLRLRGVSFRTYAACYCKPMCPIDSALNRCSNDRFNSFTLEFEIYHLFTSS